MKIFYHPTKKLWFHNNPYESYYWGSDNRQLPFFSDTDGCFSFPVKLINDKTGPIIGIIAGSSKKKGFRGNRFLFQQLQHEFYKQGGVSFVIPLNGFHSQYLDGYIYVDNKWINVKSPYPDCFYNRVPTRKDEDADLFYNALQIINHKQIPLFNRQFFLKSQLFSCLSMDKELLPFIPETRRLQSTDDLRQILLTHRQAYIKPDKGKKGEGIYFTKMMNDHVFHLKSITNELWEFTTITQLWEFLYPKLSGNHIIQQYIPLSTYHGRPYDFRILVHRSKNNWLVSGIGIRCSHNGSLTTHVPRGGEILSFKQINQSVNISLIKTIAKNVGDRLHTEYGHLGEFSMDIGLSKQNKYFLFEVNSKPMKFDEPKIFEAGINNLTSYLMEVSGFE